MSKPISWRPTEAARMALDDLVRRTGKKRPDLLNDLVIAAARGPEIAADNDRGSGAVARARLHSGGVVDPEKVAAFQRKAGMTVYDARKRKGG